MSVWNVREFQRVPLICSGVWKWKSLWKCACEGQFFFMLNLLRTLMCVEGKKNLNWLFMVQSFTVLSAFDNFIIATSCLICSAVGSLPSQKKLSSMWDTGAVYWRQTPPTSCILDFADYIEVISCICGFPGLVLYYRNFLTWRSN